MPRPERTITLRGLADNVQALLDESAPVGDPATADTAIFYSITNAQPGLAGISFGGFLIKRVADLLAAEYKGLRTFATLSPIPGFMRWLTDRVRAEEGEPLLTAAESRALAALDVPIDGPVALHATLSRPDWCADPALARALKGPLMRLSAGYLMDERRADGRALDRVADFHLTNGARMERLNWLADTAAPGLRRSAGMMMNYLYRLDEIEANHEAYTAEGRIAASTTMRSLRRG